LELKSKSLTWEMHQEHFAAGFSVAELMDSAHCSDYLQTPQRWAEET